MADERGFTLLEVLIAFSIAAAAILVIMRANVAGLDSARTAARYEEAVARARSHLANTGVARPLAAGSSSGDDGGGFQWQIDVTPVATTGAPPTGIGPPQSLTLYEIAVHVGWRETGRQREVVLRTRRLAQPEAAR